MLERFFYLTLIALTAAHPALYNRETAFFYLVLLLACLFVVTCIQRSEWPSVVHLSRPIQFGAALYVFSGILSMQASWNPTPLFFWPPSSCS